MPEPDFNTPTVYTSSPTFGQGSFFGDDLTADQFGVFRAPTRSQPKASPLTSFFQSLGPQNTSLTLGQGFNPATAQQINTANVDGGVGFLSALTGVAGAVLQNVGSTGDNPPEPQPVFATSGAGGDRTLLYVGLAAAAGVVLFMTAK